MWYSRESMLAIAFIIIIALETGFIVHLLRREKKYLLENPPKNPNFIDDFKEANRAARKYKILVYEESNTFQEDL